jgi:hypothetical protein
MLFVEAVEVVGSIICGTIRIPALGVFFIIEFDLISTSCYTNDPNSITGYQK